MKNDIVHNDRVSADTGRKLSQLLLPAPSDAAGNRFIIVPDGLDSFPMEALPGPGDPAGVSLYMLAP